MRVKSEMGQRPQEMVRKERNISPKQSTATDSKQGQFKHVLKKRRYASQLSGLQSRFCPSGTMFRGCRHEYKGPDDCPAIFQSSFTPITALWDPNLPSWNGSIYFITLSYRSVNYSQIVCKLFISAFLGGIISVFCHSCPLWDVWVFVWTLDKVAPAKCHVGRSAGVAFRKQGRHLIIHTEWK